MSHNPFQKKFFGATALFAARGMTWFHSAEFSAGVVSFDEARFASGGSVLFSRAVFSGSTVNFDRAMFSGGEVDFSDADHWSVPPAFPWTDTPPPGVKLPKLA